MTNAMIILLAQQEILKEGKIQPTGRIFKMTDADGKEISYRSRQKDPISKSEKTRSGIRIGNKATENM